MFSRQSSSMSLPGPETFTQKDHQRRAKWCGPGKKGLREESLEAGFTPEFDALLGLVRVSVTGIMYYMYCHVSVVTQPRIVVHK